MRFESMRGQNEENWKKKHILKFEKTYFLPLFFGFAFQRWFIEFEKVFM
jgi:hypothetical protein